MEYNFSKDCAVRVPMLETRALLQANVSTIEGENFRINGWRIVSSSVSSAYELASSLKNERESKINCPEPEVNLLPYACASNDLSDTKPVTSEIWTEEQGKAHDFRHEGSTGLLSKCKAVSVRVPRMKTEELRGGVPIIRVEDEVFRVSKEIKEEIEKHNQTYPAGSKTEYVESTISSKKEFNSSSTFFEKEEKVFDRVYFHVMGAETCGENEIYLSGVFVAEDF